MMLRVVTLGSLAKLEMVPKRNKRTAERLLLLMAMSR